MQAGRVASVKGDATCRTSRKRSLRTLSVRCEMPKCSTDEKSEMCSTISSSLEK